MGLLRKRQEVLDDSEWADLDDLLPKEEREELRERRKESADSLEEPKLPRKRLEGKKVEAVVKKPVKKKAVATLEELPDNKELEAAPKKQETVKKKPVVLRKASEATPKKREVVKEEPVVSKKPSEVKLAKKSLFARKEKEIKALEEFFEEEEAPEEDEFYLNKDAPIRDELGESELDEEVQALEEEAGYEDAFEVEPVEVVHRKLIAAFLYGTSVLEKSNVVLRASDEMMVLSGMRDGRITDKDVKNVLRAIKDPIQKYGEDGVDRRLGFAEKERRILAYMTGMGFNDWELTDGVVLKEFVKKYPLPMDFEAASEGFLKVIRAHSDESSIGEYVRAMENFKQQIYGLRKIYSEQIELLKRRAAEQIKTDAGLIEVSPVEARLILTRTMLLGDALVQGEIERKLTTQALIRNGLAPKWKLDFEGQQIALSKAFKSTTRDVVIAYTDVGEKTIARSYYRDTGQGIWRYLPDYAIKKNKAGKDEIWCGIGYAEEMFNLPAELQAKLSEIVLKGTLKTIDDVDFLFVGTAKAYPSVEEYLKVRRSAQLEGEVYTEVAARPVALLSLVSRHRLAPTELKVEEAELRPNFKEKLFDWQTQTTLYGKVKAECFPSMDGSLRYTFMEDNKHRAWISAIDTISEVTATGLRSQWVYSGDLVTPIFVALLSADGFGDESEKRGNYIGMWKSYVEKIQLVKEYLRSKMDRK